LPSSPSARSPLDELRIAPAIVTGLFYALLAVIAGSAIIAIGGGGIAPMRQRWEEALRRYDDEKPRLREQLQGSGAKVKERAAELKDEARGEGVAVTSQARPPTR
jgi:hypothetical protein